MLRQSKPQSAKLSFASRWLFTGNPIGIHYTITYSGLPNARACVRVCVFLCVCVKMTRNDYRDQLRSRRMGSFSNIEREAATAAPLTQAYANNFRSHLRIGWICVLSEACHLIHVISRTHIVFIEQTGDVSVKKNNYIQFSTIQDQEVSPLAKQPVCSVCKERVIYRF